MQIIKVIKTLAYIFVFFTMILSYIGFLYVYELRTEITELRYALESLNANKGYLSIRPVGSPIRFFRQSSNKIPPPFYPVEFRKVDGQSNLVPFALETNSTIP